MNNFFTYGCFYVYTAKELFEAHLAGPVHPAERIQVTMHLMQIKKLLVAIRNSLTAEGRKQFDAETKNGDPVQFANIMSIALQLTPTARNSYERFGQALLRGELIELIDEAPASETTNVQCEAAPQSTLL